MSLATTASRTPRVGEKAPNIELPMEKDAKTGRAKIFNLHEACTRGPVLVAFFPGAFTSTCTKEMRCFTDDWNQYASFGAQFIGISVDSVPSQKAWAEKQGYAVPFASDIEGRVLRQWGLVWNAWWGPVYKRATFIVDRTGHVRYADVLADADLEPDYAQIKAAFRDLR